MGVETEVRGARAGWRLPGGGRGSQHRPHCPSTDAPGQYGAYFYDNGFLALPGRVFSRR